MKKIVIIAILLFFVHASNFGQRSVYYDALFLKSIVDDGAFSHHFTVNIQSREIFDRYFPNLNDQAIDAAIKANPFLKTYYITNDGTMSASVSDLKMPGLISSVGSLDVTNFADGLAKFLVERVKQELSTSFFERFKNDLDSTRQLQILFPSTFRALMAIDKEIYNYASYIDLLRESFQKDMAMMLPNIRRLVNDQCMSDVFNKYPFVKIILSDALFIIDELSQGKFTGEVLHNYIANEADSVSLYKVNQYLYPALATFDLFSQSLRSTKANQYWISKDSLKLLFDPTTFQIYFGLIYQQAKNSPIYFSDKVTLDSIFRLHKDSILPKYKSYLNGLVTKGKTVEYYYSNIERSQKDGKTELNYQDYYSLLDASISLLEYLTQFPYIDKLTLSVDFENYFSSARSLGNIYIDVYEKQYTSAIVEFSGLLQNLILDTLQKSTGLEQTYKKYKAINTKIIEYGGLAASIAKAENSDDVKNAIEAAALPSGSSRIKRETQFNVSLNAYTGPFIGAEKIIGFDNKFKINSFGLTAPIGVATSWGVNHWSLTGFVSLIDLGAVAAFRFQNDSVAQVPTIQLKDIFSPGLFFSIGIPKCPLSVNLGAQVGPNLRKIYSVEDEETGELVYNNQYDNNVYWRFSVSLVVDIPIFSFYTKSK